MRGTSTEAVFVTALAPRKSTAAASTAIAAPTTGGGAPKELLQMPAAAFVCTIFPVPKEASTQQPHQKSEALRPPKACSIYPMAPPGYFTAKAASPNLSIMPSSAPAHIQKTAPAPPTATAEATPTMLPVPAVAPRAVAMAAKPPLLFLRLPNVLFAMKRIFRSGKNPLAAVKNAPLKSTSSKSPGPHTNSAARPMIFSAASTKTPPKITFYYVYANKAEKCSEKQNFRRIAQIRSQNFGCFAGGRFGIIYC